MIPRILIVDDDRYNRQLLQDLLVHGGFDVTLAQNADEAWQALAQGLPDLVLMDIRLGGGSGEALMRRIRTRPDGQRLVILAVTASAMAGDRERLLAAGFDGYYSKPLELRRLLYEVAGHVARGKAIG